MDLSPTQDEFYDEVSPRFHVKRWTLVRLAWLLVVLVGAYSFYLGQRNDNRILQESRNREYNACVSSNDGRRALRDVIDIATVTGAPGLDLTKLPSFPRLGKETQDWIKELNAILTAPQSETSAAARLRVFSDERLFLRNCEELPR